MLTGHFSGESCDFVQLMKIVQNYLQHTYYIANMSNMFQAGIMEMTVIDRLEFKCHPDFDLHSGCYLVTRMQVKIGT
jgi:hypothetical protein